MSILDKRICLTLNSIWQPISVQCVKRSLNDLYSGTFQALNIEYKLEGNKYDFNSLESINTVDWDEWIKLPVRNFDYRICTPSLSLRAPTVLITKRYSKMPIANLKPTAKGVRKRDNNVCQYTGKKLSNDQGSIDHILPRAKGGNDSWENLVYCEREINLFKGDRTLTESGLKLIKTPKEPMGKLLCTLFSEAKHKDWEHFLLV